MGSGQGIWPDVLVSCSWGSACVAAGEAGQTWCLGGLGALRQLQGEGGPALGCDLSFGSVLEYWCHPKVSCTCCLFSDAKNILRFHHTKGLNLEYIRKRP